jgi:Mg2+ and Co2+ transporter CorA
MQSNKELNATMGRLTVIMTFLTIVSIVVSVPGTVGAIFGIPALSDAYFRPHTLLLVLVLIMTTLLSIVLGFAYWKSLNLRSPRR